MTIYITQNPFNINVIKIEKDEYSDLDIKNITDKEVRDNISSSGYKEILYLPVNSLPFEQNQQMCFALTHRLGVAVTMLIDPVFGVVSAGDKLYIVNGIKDDDEVRWLLLSHNEF